MKKNNIFRHELNESIQADAAMNCLKNRNNHKQLSESADFDADDFISNVVNLMEDEGMIDNSQWDAAYYTVKEMVQSKPELLQYPSYMQFLNVFGDDILSKLNNQEQEENSLDTEYFSDLEEQEAYYANFRAIAELVADQIDRENGKDIDNNMDTLFEIVREVWNNNPDDLYIWDFDDVQEKDCYKFFDKYYETIKNEYLKREHNNIMAATHDDLFASEQEEMPQMERHDMILALSEYMSESWIDTGDDGDLDDIYYAVAEVLDKTGDYPASTNWKDCKPWCQKHYREVEETVMGGGF